MPGMTILPCERTSQMSVRMIATIVIVTPERRVVVAGGETPPLLEVAEAAARATSHPNSGAPTSKPAPLKPRPCSNTARHTPRYVMADLLGPDPTRRNSQPHESRDYQ